MQLHPGIVYRCSTVRRASILMRPEDRDRCTMQFAKKVRVEPLLSVLEASEGLGICQRRLKGRGELQPELVEFIQFEPRNSGHVRLWFRKGSREQEGGRVHYPCRPKHWHRRRNGGE